MKSMKNATLVASLSLAACAPVDDTSETRVDGLTERPVTVWERTEDAAVSSSEASSLRSAMRACANRLSLLRRAGAAREDIAAQVSRCEEIEAALRRLQEEPVREEDALALRQRELTRGPRSVCEGGVYAGAASFHDCRDGAQVVVHTESYKCPDETVMTVEVRLDINGLACTDPPKELWY